MALQLDELDVKLLGELQRDADRPNVKLARLVGLSPTATMHRLRRLKASGVVAGIAARLDPDVAGFPLRVFVQLTLARHTEAAEKRLEEVVAGLPQVTQADWVAGETDVLPERRRARHRGAPARAHRPLGARRRGPRRHAPAHARDEGARAAAARLTRPRA